MKNNHIQHFQKGDIISPSEKQTNLMGKVLRPTVAVIIPTLNEAENLPLVLPYLPISWINEVILVDGRSTDNTIEVAKEFLPSIKIVIEKRKGKGVALRTGYQAAESDILIVLDADGSNDPREIPRFVSALLEGADFAKGSRFAPGGGTTDMPRYRKMGNGTFTLLSNLLFDLKFTDLCYGYHAFWKYCLDILDLDDFNGFEIDTALYLQAARKHLKVVDVPSFEGFRFYGVGKLQTIPDGWRVLRTIFNQWFKTFRKEEKLIQKGFRGVQYARPTGFEETVPTEKRGFSERFLEFFRFMRLLTSSVDDTKNLMQKILKIALETVDASSGSLILLDEKGKVRDGCLVSADGDVYGENVAWTEVLEQGVAGWAIRNRQSVLILDTKADERWLQRDWDKEQRSALTLPLSVGGIVVGALTMIRLETEKFTENELNALEKVTKDISQEVELEQIG